MKRFYLIKMVLLISVVFTSCEKEDPLEIKPPTVTFSKEDGIYVVKQGREITIEPTVENDIDALYSWTTSDGVVIGRDKKLTHKWDQNGQIYLTFMVSTDYGSVDKEIRVDVAQLVPPTISLTPPNSGYMVEVGKKLVFSPVVDNGDNASYLWKVGDKSVATTKDYTFVSDVEGEFHLSLSTANEDGSDLMEFDVLVKSVGGMLFAWIFESDVYNVSVGRNIRLMPYGIANSYDAEYVWSVDGEQIQRSSDPKFVFNAQKEGSYMIDVKMENSHISISKKLTVNVCAKEGAYKRAASVLSEVDWNKVYEFRAAPGQFVNEGYVATTMFDACLYAEQRLKDEQYLSLGGFGGYVVVGFDHSIENDGDYNLQVLGNSFNGSSEPGIVYVMQDENGDTFPNDTWYELKGSEHGKIETIKDYEVTYYRPRAAAMGVEWSDNRGKKGIVDYLPAYHRQDYYYPLWIDQSSYTLRGTCLKSNSREVSSGFWSNDTFDWGYTDNFSPIDRLSNSDNSNADVNANHFKISNAVDFNGEPVTLKYIDFVKIQTGVNSKAGWLGEVSTEVFGVKDYNLLKRE